MEIRRAYWAAAGGIPGPPSGLRRSSINWSSSEKKSVDYRQSGVDIDAGNEVVRRIKQMARATYTPGVLSGVGSFGGLFALDGLDRRPGAGGLSRWRRHQAQTRVHDRGSSPR